ncbi:MAG: ndufa8, NADH-ubiquinone oxidoreductase complex I 19kd subunit [Ramalina farinacea]|uniref:NADH-ubiquinone oxidoreductase n=1 Tax=Ramalina farinacea TaxID=258253 RepID=A0AA43QK68_9LECA|nr:ndufa8, NADH-ubiquinone oxidoreductase complex I 19kd subunit [Ramalina farinacea]
MSAREPRFSQKVLIDPTPLPASVPPVTECGTSSAPLMSASFFIGDRCKAFNDDYMQCKTEAYGRGEKECMREGRKVTRCAKSVIDDINKSCLDSFRAHWECLEHNNQQMWHCRRPEQRLNDCVFEKIGLKKEIPGTPEGETPVHLRDRQIFSTKATSKRIKDPRAGKPEETKAKAEA